MSAQHELVAKIQDLMRKNHGGTDGAARRSLFAAYDTNGDGQICRSELAKLLDDAGVGNALTRNFWVKGVIARLDTDDTETISFAELEEAIADE